MWFSILCFLFQEGDTENEPYDDEEFEGYEEKPDSSPGKSEDLIKIVDVSACYGELALSS